MWYKGKSCLVLLSIVSGVIYYMHVINILMDGLRRGKEKAMKSIDNMGVFLV